MPSFTKREKVLSIVYKIIKDIQQFLIHVIYFLFIYFLIIRFCHKLEVYKHLDNIPFFIYNYIHTSSQLPDFAAWIYWTFILISFWNCKISYQPIKEDLHLNISKGNRSSTKYNKILGTSLAFSSQLVFILKYMTFWRLNMLYTFQIRYSNII